MKVHLVKSAEVETELFTSIIQFLQAVPGPIKFVCDESSVIDFEKEEVYFHEIESRKEFESKVAYSLNNISCDEMTFPLKRSTASWKTLFKKCAAYRTENKIALTDFVFLLTDIPNDRNWFASLDKNMPFNGFVHTADWEHYIECSAAFPVAYEIIALILQKHMFDGDEALRSAVHVRPMGCVNDLCINKTEIILKLRTADVCRDCIELLKDKLSVEVVHHALEIMESVRMKMLYAQNFRQNAAASPMVIKGNNRIFLPGFSNIEIMLRPLEKALYFLFLYHPGGMHLSSLCDYRSELYEIYGSLCRSGMNASVKMRVDDLVNALNNSANEKISRIKRVFEETIGDELAKMYYIRGDAGGVKKVELDRKLVSGI